jgi:hypothetical protein
MQRDTSGEAGATHTADVLTRSFPTGKPGKYFSLGEKASPCSPIRLFSPSSANFLWVKAVQERLFTPTDLTG